MCHIVGFMVYFVPSIILTSNIYDQLRFFLGPEAADTRNL